MTRQGSGLTDRLRAATLLRAGDSVEEQHWGRQRCAGGFPHATAPDGTTHGGGLPHNPQGGRVGGRRFHLGGNGGVSDAEAYAIYQALDARSESNTAYTVFSD